MDLHKSWRLKNTLTSKRKLMKIIYLTLHTKLWKGKEYIFPHYHTTLALFKNETVLPYSSIKHFFTFLADKQCSNQTRVKIHCHVLMRIVCISKTGQVSFSRTNFFCYIPNISVDLAWKYSIVSFFYRWCSVIIQAACQEKLVGRHEDKE